MQLLEILLAVDNETVGQALSATLRRAGHRVTVSTTIAGAVETLMRRGPHLDIIMTSTRFGSSLGDDVIEYSRKFAAHAQLIVLPETTGSGDDIDLVLARQPVFEHLGTSESN